ncbi:acyl transferase/acyl hydrolase/lysophospholipase [Panaeolus papilionaceus]|nr:acyl transferase/acyl hydrolase/lysophospholipase [Panaeolus papilionaceus]
MCYIFHNTMTHNWISLIAMMLGRLRMTIAQCEEAYDVISREVFGKRRRGWIGNEIGEKSAFAAYTYMYEEKPLEEAVKRIVKEALGDSEATLAEPNPTCRVLVMSALASATEDAKTAVHLRNYDVGKTLPSSYTNFKIWEAARATSAAPIYFKRFEKDGKEFVDGGMGWNNPVFELVSELPAIFGTNFRIGALVSLGSGVPVLTQLRTAGITHVQDYIVVPTNSENPAHTFKKMAPILPRPGEEKYWRFNLDKASCKGYPFEYDGLMTKMDDCEAIDDIRRLTDLWLKDKSRSDSIAACARKLTGL